MVNDLFNWVAGVMSKRLRESLQLLMSGGDALALYAHLKILTAPTFYMRYVKSEEGNLSSVSQLSTPLSD